METKIDLQGSTALIVANQMTKICEPLRKINVSGFQYMRRFLDGSRFILCDCPELIKYFYEEGFYPLTWYDNDKSILNYRSGIELWPINSLYNSPEQESLANDMRQLFNITHSITYLNKEHHFLEIIRFFSNDSSIYLLNFKIFVHFDFLF